MNRATRKIFALWMVCMALGQVAFAQNSGLYGRVVDGIGEPLIGATVRLDYASSDVFVAGQITDVDGRFVFERLKPGKYQATVQYLGYMTTRQVVTVMADKRTELNVEMREFDVIIGPPVLYIWTPRSTSTYLSEADLFSAPAVYDDPGRAIALQAGVVATNDQANHLSVRGNNPGGVKWFLEGLELPNPNHTPNAGTASDRTTQAGGGVNILKPQFLRGTAFLKGAFQPGVGNVTGGAINANIKDSPPPTSDVSVRLGLIGTEAYLSHSPDPNIGDYLHVNARYSTVGFLTDVLGLDFGGERINYYDVNAAYTRPVKGYGKLKFFHVSGRSANRYQAPRDSTAWEESRDRFDIDFGAAMAFTGASYRYSKSSKTLSISLGHAYSRSTRTAALLQPDLLTTRTLQTDTLQEHRLSLYGYYHQNRLTATMRLQQQWHTIGSTDEWADFQSSGRLQGLLVQPSLRYLLMGGRHTLLYAGVHGMAWTANGSWSLEPRLQLTRKVRRWGADMTLAYGLHSQQQTATTYLSQNAAGEYLNRNLGFTRAHHINLDWEESYQRAEQKPHGIHYKVSAYFQYLFDVPIALGSDRSFAVLNEITPLVAEPLANDGAGRNYGLELLLNKETRSAWSLSLNGAWYRSEYRGGDGIWRNTRYNGQWMTNFRIGKAFERPEYVRKRTDENIKEKRGFYLRAWAAGGLWQSPIDVAASAATGTTTFVESAAYTLRDEASYRADLRLFWEREVLQRKRNFEYPIRKHTLALDIQNLTNRRNVAFNYFDPLQQAVITKRQLGLIPLLSWTVTW